MNRQERKHHHRPSRQPLTKRNLQNFLCICVDFLANTHTHQPLTTMQTQTKYQQCWQCAGKEKNFSEATATCAQSYLLPFRTIVPIKEIMWAKFMAGWQMIVTAKCSPNSRRHFCQSIHRRLSKYRLTVLIAHSCVASISCLSSIFF